MNYSLLEEKNNTKTDPVLLFLVMAYMSIMLSSGILTSKLILMGNMVTFAGAIIAPFWFLISDIIAEIYGLKIARSILWYSFFCQLLFGAICITLSQFPSPDYWHGQEAYDFVTGPLLRVTYSAFIAYMISGYLNVYLLLKLKLLTKGKHFWLRSIFASLIGEAIFTIIAVTMIEFNKAPPEIIVKIILTSYAVKIICSILSSLPANLFVQLIKKYNSVVAYEKNN